MMETKLWIWICALLLINLGSAEHDDGHVTASSALAGKASSVAPTAGSVSTSGLDLSSHAAAASAPPPSGPDTNPGSRINGSLSNGTTTERELPLTPEAKKDNDTNTTSHPETVVSEINKNLTEESTLQPPIPPSESHAPTPLTSTTTSPTTNTTLAAVLLPDSTTPSKHSTHSRTSTSAPPPEPPKPETTATTTIAQSSSASSTSSSQKPPKSEAPTLTSPQKTSRPDGHPQTSTEPHPTSSTSRPSSQAKAQANTPSQLTVQGDTTMVHESPTLDPLLAGLVSAFIITAVIITLLLFLKLRRRDNRPEFRRLQDLPMDDMMEDTPLSMYSY